jgi:hypothetical protein
MVDECEAVGEMRTGDENRNILRKPASLPQNPYDSNWE